MLGRRYSRHLDIALDVVVNVSAGRKPCPAKSWTLQQVPHATVVELADAQDLGAGEYSVGLSLGLTVFRPKV